MKLCVPHTRDSAPLLADFVSSPGLTRSAAGA